jgi:hypothetical protein
LQVTVRLARVQVPSELEAETKSTCVGRVSVTTTPDASFAPALLTVIV